MIERTTALLAAALVAALVAGGDSEVARGLPCVPRDFGFSSVACVCNATYCDSLPRVVPGAAGTAQVYVSSKAGLRLQREDVPFTETTEQSKTQTLTVHRNVTYQTVYGFGGAFTDAAGINILSLPKEAQELLLRSYFSEDGLEYNMGRVPIGGSDFSTHPYSYADDSTKKSIATFKLTEEDLVLKIPLIRRAKDLMSSSSDDLLLFSALWSPPPWMKSNGEIAGYAQLKKEFYQDYADYYIKFFDAYEALNVTFHCVSTGNEPLNGIIPFKYFNSLGWWPSDLHEWIRDHFGPTIRNSRHKDIRIMAHDDQRILLPWQLNMVLDDQTTTDYIDIIGYHWYMNFITPNSILDKIHEKYPNKPIISSEACNGDKPWDFKRVQPGSWTRGQYYLDDIIEVMNHRTAGWMDWNLALDMDGGPNWAKNHVDAPILVDKEKGEFYKNPTFYALAHASKFVPRGSVRVHLKSKGGPLLSSEVKHIAFKRPDNGLVVILINKHYGTRKVAIQEEGRGQVYYKVPPSSFVTIVYW